MMFFKRKSPLIKVTGIAAPKIARNTADIIVKAIKKPDSDGQVRRMLRTIEDNRLL